MRQSAPPRPDPQPLRLPPVIARLPAIPLAVGVALLVASCGGPPAPEPALPTAVSSPTARPTAPASVAAVSATRPPDVTLDQLFTRIQSGWSGEIRFREITTFTTASGAVDAATSGNDKTGSTLREVFGPGEVRAAAEENNRLLYEMMISGDDIYLRGTIATLIDPTLPAGEWLRTDRAVVAAQPQLGESLLGPLLLEAPTYRPPDRLLPQIVRELGPTADGCLAYAAADTTTTGARVDFTIAVQPTGALCRIETRSPGLASTYQVEPMAPNAAIALPATFRQASSVAGSPPASPLAAD